MVQSIRIARRLLALCALVIIITVPTQAAGRRRAVGKGPAIAGPSGQCHTFGFVRAGLQASYASTTSNGGTATYTITYLSDTATQTKTTQVVSTPQGNATAVTTLTGESVGNLRGIKHIDVDTTITVPVLGALTTEIDVDFVPSLIAGPLQGWCVGETWDVAPVTETVVAKIPLAPQGPPIIVTTIGSQGKVLAVGESVTVPGGTFNTVKYQGLLVSDNVQPAVTWVSMEHNIVVKQQTFDAVSGALTSDTVLTNVQ
jgi:hypothetical protein